MRILFLKGYYYPEIAASLYLTTNLVEGAAESGNTVEVYAPTPTRGVSAEERREYIKNKKTEILYDGKIIIKRFSMFKEPKNSLLRAFRYTLCIIKQFFCGLGAKNIDIVYAGSTPPINGLMFPFFKWFKNFKIVYNLQDVFPDSLVNTGMTKKGSLIWKIGALVEKITYKYCDKIIVISEDFKENIMAKGVPEEKIEVIYNWVDENKVVDVKKQDNPLFDKYKLDRNKFYICYSGNIGHTQNMEMLCEVAKEIESYSDIGFVIVGDGAFRTKLEEIISKMELNNITLIPFQDYKNISYVFSLGDMGLIISKKGIGTNSVPSKAWSVLSAKRPIVASFDKGSELDKIITENNCGICVEADDKEALKSAIIDCFNNRESLSQMGENGRDFILQNLTKDIGTSKIIDVLKDTVGERKAIRIPERV